MLREKKKHRFRVTINYTEENELDVGTKQIHVGRAPFVSGQQEQFLVLFRATFENEQRMNETDRFDPPEEPSVNIF